MIEPHRDYPRLFPRPEQTIAGIGRLLRDGQTTCVEILDRCFDQVEEWEPKVHAWVRIDHEGAIAQAKSLDDELKSGRDRGPLHGVPIGVKDIIDVKGLPTACGAKRWADRTAREDADVVKGLRAAGAVIVGKTVTTPYAWIDPPPTRNPWNLDRTPGGSSSGSAAAVACGMCFAALGTQTGGSITRPASYCGVAGMKPDRFFVSLFGGRAGGIAPLADSLDHVGPIARCVDDLRIMFEAMMAGHRIRAAREAALRASTTIERPPSLGRPRGFFDRRAVPEILDVMDKAVRALALMGADISETDDPIDFEQALKSHRTVLAAEAAYVHSDDLDAHPDDYPPRIRDLVKEGRAVLAIDYFKSQHARGAINVRKNLETFSFEGHRNSFLVTPATTGTAPGPATTGDPAFNSPWSYTGQPTVSFPAGLASDGMPVALQIVGPEFFDGNLLRVASWCEQVIRTSQQ